MSNSIAPGSSADVNVKVTALTTNPNVPVTYKTIILKKNLVNGVNTLTQEMMSAQNTKYVIKYDYVLGEDITVPANCVLEFDGGSISGAYTITGNNTNIKAGLVKIFNTNVTIAGTWNIEGAYPEWFGTDGIDDDIELIKAFSFSHPVFLLEKEYIISNPIPFRNSIISNGVAVIKPSDNFSGNMMVDFYNAPHNLTIKRVHFNINFNNISAISSSVNGQDGSLANIEECNFFNSGTDSYPVSANSTTAAPGALTGCRFEGCRFEGCEKWCYIGNNQDDVLFINCRFGPSYQQTGIPIVIRGCNVKFDSCYISFNNVIDATENALICIGKFVTFDNMFFETSKTSNINTIFWLDSPNSKLSCSNIVLNIDTPNLVSLIKTYFSSSWESVDSVIQISVNGINTSTFNEINASILTTYNSAVGKQRINLIINNCDLFKYLYTAQGNGYIDAALKIFGNFRGEAYYGAYSINRVFGKTSNVSVMSDNRIGTFKILPGCYNVRITALYNNDANFAVHAQYTICYINADTFPIYKTTVVVPPNYNPSSYFGFTNIDVSDPDSSGVVTITPTLNSYAQSDIVFYYIDLERVW